MCTAYGKGKYLILLNGQTFNACDNKEEWLDPSLRHTTKYWQKTETQHAGKIIVTNFDQPLQLASLNQKCARNVSYRS